ncbi:MAG: RNA polymerase subunit AC19 [Geoglossum umbratile]|nr:MAG: RNA polymerase subunit AC19 [Geoglossum umbratile]
MSSASQDQPMADAPTGEGTAPAAQPMLEVAADNRIRVLPGSSDTATSFQLEGEDHTLGNALRYIIMKNPLVEFCGYSIPHPSEAKMNIRIQTYDGTTAYDALMKGFEDLANLCDVVVDKFNTARSEFAQRDPMDLSNT